MKAITTLLCFTLVSCSLLCQAQNKEDGYMAKSNKVVKVNSTQKSVQSAADLNASENHAFGTKKKEDRMPTDKPTIMKSSNDSFRVKATAQKED